MKIGCLILMHHLPEMGIRLARRIAPGIAAVVVQMDARMQADEVIGVSREIEGLERVSTTRHRCCEWGRLSLVQATLDAIESLLELCPDVDYGILLSGQDYPLTDAPTRERVLEAAGGRSFLSHFPLPAPRWHNGMLDADAWKLVLPAGWTPYGGSQWWILSRACLEYVNGYAKRNPEVVARFGGVFAPDESFFQTVLCNSALASTLVNDNLRFIEWRNLPHPVTLTTRHFTRLRASRCLFARKFDPGVDPRVLDLIDSLLLGVPGTEWRPPGNRPVAWARLPAVRLAGRPRWRPHPPAPLMNRRKAA